MQLLSTPPRNDRPQHRIEASRVPILPVLAFCFSFEQLKPINMTCIAPRYSRCSSKVLTSLEAFPTKVLRVRIEALKRRGNTPANRYRKRRFHSPANENHVTKRSEVGLMTKADMRSNHFLSDVHLKTQVLR